MDGRSCGRYGTNDYMHFSGSNSNDGSRVQADFRTKESLKVQRSVSKDSSCTAKGHSEILLNFLN